MQGSAHEFEVIVTDDSNNDKSEKLVTENFGWVKWVLGPKLGPASNRNNGARHAKNHWIIFIDDDCLPDKDIVNTYIDAIQLHKGITVFEGCIKADREQRSFTEESPVNETGEYLWSCNFMIEKQLFLGKLHGFDEKFPYASMEDVDLAYRIKKLHIPIVFIKDAFVIHPWRDQKNLYSMTFKRYKSTLYFIDKHPEKKTELSSTYFLKIFFRSMNNLFNKAIKFRFRGFIPELTNDFIFIYFAIHRLYNQNK
jgi:GT2 family glycosyltransferase